MIKDIMRTIKWRLVYLKRYYLGKKITDDLNVGERKIIIFDEANNGNMGDQAIVYAQTEFIKKNFPTDRILHFSIGWGVLAGKYEHCVFLQRLSTKRERL